MAGSVLPPRPHRVCPTGPRHPPRRSVAPRASRRTAPRDSGVEPRRAGGSAVQEYPSGASWVPEASRSRTFGVRGPPRGSMPTSGRLFRWEPAFWRNPYAAGEGVGERGARAPRRGFPGEGLRAGRSLRKSLPAGLRRPSFRRVVLLPAFRTGPSGARGAAQSGNLRNGSPGVPRDGTAPTGQNRVTVAARPISGAIRRIDRGLFRSSRPDDDERCALPTLADVPRRPPSRRRWGRARARIACPRMASPPGPRRPAPANEPRLGPTPARTTGRVGFLMGCQLGPPAIGPGRLCWSSRAGPSLRRRLTAAARGCLMVARQRPSALGPSAVGTPTTRSVMVPGAIARCAASPGDEDRRWHRRPGAREPTAAFRSVAFAAPPGPLRLLHGRPDWSLVAPLPRTRTAPCEFAGIGVPVLARSGAGWRATAFDTFGKELEELVACGLAPVGAVRAATGAALTVLGYGDRFGTIAPGRIADLVAVDGDPPVDLGCLRRVRATSRAGGQSSRRQRTGGVLGAATALPPPLRAEGVTCRGGHPAVGYGVAAATTMGSATTTRRHRRVEAVAVPVAVEPLAEGVVGDGSPG